jgi:hypothetical protein
VNEEMKLTLALMQVNNIVELTKDNEWKNYLYGHLSSLKVELERQLTNCMQSDKMKTNRKDQ